ncbi:alkaline phosphatase family protein [Membranihabitans marinus]|uniref:alkaline phosphatase family protein n=1 Tax=Membranihabitans marinus TaxID=1227546 RepID=UPI001F1BA02C|nr:nucleotide pyrophosphatase/phosphodiesterase family protein [Membranihabitans marinus]
MHKTVVINIVGLSKSIIGQHTPFIKQYIDQHHITNIKPVFPAVTTVAQSTYLTKSWPSDHGIVGNGWYDKIDSEIKFWKQSNPLVQGKKIWDKAKEVNPDFTCSKMFWWYNMYSTADYSATPRPQYHADGVKQPDCYTHPSDLRDELQSKFGTFPLFHFWGPKTSIKASEWILDASLYVDKKYDPKLTLIYLPHLDYGLQKYGPHSQKIEKDLKEIDDLVSKAVSYYEKQGCRIILLSEYGINPVNHPIHINRILRSHGWLQTRVENKRELLDPGGSKAFAVADHQVAHIYINDDSIKSDLIKKLESIQEIQHVIYGPEKEKFKINHKRSGDIVLQAQSNAWFTYYYWEDENKAPDFAHSVDIHKKPGYDPVELFLDPKNPFITLKAIYKVARKKLGFRYRMNIIPTDAELIKGSHGSIGVENIYHPVIISSKSPNQDVIEATEVYDWIWDSIFND